MFSLLATALGLFPTFAAADIIPSDVLTIDGTNFTLNEPTSGTEATLTTPPIPLGFFVNPAVSPSLVALQEVDAVTGTPLVDPTGAPVISDYLQTNVVQTGSFLSGPFNCISFLPADPVSYATCFNQHGLGDYSVSVPLYGYQFTLTSNSDPNGLPTLSTTNRNTILRESPSGVDLSSFVTGGQLSVMLQSDVDAASVPEPSSILLLGTGLLGLMVIGLYRKRLA